MHILFVFLKKFRNHLRILYTVLFLCQTTIGSSTIVYSGITKVNENVPKSGLQTHNPSGFDTLCLAELAHRHS